MEIERLHEMLLAAGIEHDWVDRRLRVYDVYGKLMPDLFPEGEDRGWQIVVYYPDGERMISAIEGWGTYGFKDDLIEIMGLLTPEEAEHDSVIGWLTAEDVFERIKKEIK